MVDERIGAAACGQRLRSRQRTGRMGASCVSRRGRSCRRGSRGFWIKSAKPSERGTTVIPSQRKSPDSRGKRPPAKGGSRGRAAGRDCESGGAAHVAALLRDTPAGGRIRHPHGPGAVGAPGRFCDPSVPSSGAYRGMIYTHVLSRGGRGVESPAGRLLVRHAWDDSPRGRSRITAGSDRGDGS